MRGGSEKKGLHDQNLIKKNIHFNYKMFLCRTCGGGMSAKIGCKKQLFIHCNRTLITQIKLITGLELQHLSGFPYHMCKRCFEDLGRAIMFRRKCIEAEHKFILMHEEDKVLDEVLGPILVKKDIISSICTNQKNNQLKKTVPEQNILDIGHDSGGANSNNRREASFTATCINGTQSIVKIKTEIMSSDDDEDLNQTNNIEFCKQKSFNNSLHEEDKVLDEVLSPIWDKEDIILDAVLRPSNCTNQKNNQRKKNVAEQNILDIVHDCGGANSNSQMDTQSLVKIKNEIMSSDDDEDMNQTNNVEFSRQSSFDISENKAEIDSYDDYHQNLIQCAEVKSEPVDPSDTLIKGEFEPKESLESETIYCLPDEEKCKEKARANVFACNKCDMNFMTARSLGQHKRIHNDSTILPLDVDRMVRQKIQSRMRSKRYRDRLKQLRVNLQL